MAALLGLATAQQKGIFILYITLWISYGFLNQRAKNNNLTFNSASAVLVAAVLKLGIAIYMFLSQDGSPQYLIETFKKNLDCFVIYLIPAGLYGIYDILAYVNLQKFDAPTYFLLLNFRLVLTGLVHQSLFKLQMHRNQWMALIIITIGCVIKTAGNTIENQNEKSTGIVGYSLILFQVIASTLAGVCNELFLKKKTNIPSNLQNIFMYIDSIFCLCVIHVLKLNGESLDQALAPENIRVLFSLNVFPMILIMSVIGVVTSFFLKILDSVRKAIASALELVVLPLLVAVFLNVNISPSLAISVFLVCIGVYLYSQVPPRETNALPISINSTLGTEESTIDSSSSIKILKM